MALAVNVIDRHGPSNEMRCHLQPKETKVTLYYPNSKRRFISPSLLTTRRIALVLKVGVSYGWKMTKCDANYS